MTRFAKIHLYRIPYHAGTSVSIIATLLVSACGGDDPTAQPTRIDPSLSYNQQKIGLKLCDFTARETAKVVTQPWEKAARPRCVEIGVPRDKPPTDSLMKALSDRYGVAGSSPAGVGTGVPPH
jgi:hypothetical protein